MTEAEWLDEKTHPQRMVRHLSDCGYPRSKIGRRKLRLFACGCCRVIWDVIPYERLRETVLVAERFADGQVSKAELSAVGAALDGWPGFSGSVGFSTESARAALVAISMSVETIDPRPFHSAFMMTAMGQPLAGVMPAKQAEARLGALLRDVFGNPFRPISLDRSWRTSTVTALARQLYDSRDFSNMPILADALQDAGCDSEEILNHCRQPGEHIRGCWALDLVLGRGVSR